jgi:uncharacterized damage-inducible protein DinB
VTVEDLKAVFDYSYWANDRLCDVLSQLTTEQFTQPVAGSFGSIRNTMVHMLSAEWGWLERCGGAARGPALNAQDYPTVASLFDRWQHVEARVRAFLSTLQDEDLGRVVEFAIGGGARQWMALGQLLHHAAVHGVHRRGQVALLLRTRSRELRHPYLLRSALAWCGCIFTVFGANALTDDQTLQG